MARLKGTKKGGDAPVAGNPRKPHHPKPIAARLVTVLLEPSKTGIMRGEVRHPTCAEPRQCRQRLLPSNLLSLVFIA